MPESAEVRRLINDMQLAVGYTVKESTILSGRYKRQPIPGFAQLVGYTITGIACKGKIIMMALQHKDNDLAPQVRVLSTLGMTGWWHVSDNDTIIPQRHAPTEEVGHYNVRHARLRLDLGDRVLIFTDPRNFGTFKVTTVKGAAEKLAELGPDIAHHQNIPAEFWPRFERFCKKKTIAEALLDQRVFCGVGNYIRADAMYEAGIDPRVLAHDVSKRDLGQLWHCCALVANASFLDKSITGKDRFFYNVCYGRSHDDHDNLIETFQDRNGRTVWWCPARQAIGAA